MPVTTHPSLTNGRHTEHHGVIGDIAAHRCARTHEGIPSDGRTANDSGVRANRRAAPHERALIEMMTHDLRARIRYVCEYAGRATEHIVFKNHAGIERDVILNF